MNFAGLARRCRVLLPVLPLLHAWRSNPGHFCLESNARDQGSFHFPPPQEPGPVETSADLRDGQTDAFDAYGGKAMNPDVASDIDNHGGNAAEPQLPADTAIARAAEAAGATLADADTTMILLVKGPCAHRAAQQVFEQYAADNLVWIKQPELREANRAHWTLRFSNPLPCHLLVSSTDPLADRWLALIFKLGPGIKVVVVQPPSPGPESLQRLRQAVEEASCADCFTSDAPEQVFKLLGSDVDLLVGLMARGIRSFDDAVVAHAEALRRKLLRDLAPSDAGPLWDLMLSCLDSSMGGISNPGAAISPADVRLALRNPQNFSVLFAPQTRLALTPLARRALQDVLMQDDAFFSSMKRIADQTWAQKEAALVQEQLAQLDQAQARFEDQDHLDEIDKRLGRNRLDVQRVVLESRLRKMRALEAAGTV